MNDSLRTHDGWSAAEGPERKVNLLPLNQAAGMIQAAVGRARGRVRKGSGERDSGVGEQESRSRHSGGVRTADRGRRATIARPEDGGGAEAMSFRYAIVTFGCRVNQADSLAAEESLLANGGIPSPTAEADLIIVNTCSVTAAADQGARQTIRRRPATIPPRKLWSQGATPRGVRTRWGRFPASSGLCRTC